MSDTDFNLIRKRCDSHQVKANQMNQESQRNPIFYPNDLSTTAASTNQISTRSDVLKPEEEMEEEEKNKDHTRGIYRYLFNYLEVMEISVGLF